jgi:short-subunit dehydrogenase
LKILLTKVRKESLSGALLKILSGESPNEVRYMGNVWCIDALCTYPSVEFLSEYDVIINTTGKTLNQSVLDFEYNNTMNIFSVNTAGAMLLTSRFAKTKISSGDKGLIIHVGSTGSRKVFTNCSAYCASKAALAHYIQCAGYELKNKNISVVGIHPGNIEGTKMTNQVKEDLIKKRGMTQEQIEKIYSDAHDVKDVANFICQVINMPWNDITGENFYMGNGWKG